MGYGKRAKPNVLPVFITGQTLHNLPDQDINFVISPQP
jgi:hypothetical protein